MLPPPPAERPSPSGAQASRRHALKLGALGLAGLAAPLAAQVGGSSFTHAVASGEPGPDRVLLWTRFVAPSETRLVWELSETQDFAKLAASGEALAAPERDHCAKALASGLAAGRWYYYRFIAPSGAVSPIGRTRTLPVGGIKQFKLAVFTCANFGFGWFNAYAHAVEAGDFDLAVHLGDYFYEYRRGEYPTAEQALAGRTLPVNEAVLLADYRERLSTYRADPDLQRLHQILPMVAMWDDHEVANDTWQNGAENHQSGTEGDWQLRKAASERAWREWLPVSDHDWAQYDIGELATLYRLESRHVARSEPLSFAKALSGAAPGQAEAALTAFRDGAWSDPARELLGAKQQGWLGQSLKHSVRSGTKWQVLGQQIVMGQLIMPDALAEGVTDKAPTPRRKLIGAMLAASHVGLPFNMDAWDGYPAARQRLYEASLAADANLLVLSGDSHNAWAFDLDYKGARVGVEMAAHSVTSPGAETEVPWLAPERLASATVARNPQLKWCDTARRGYLSLELTPSHATGEWRFLSTVRERSTALTGVQRMTVLAGKRRFSAIS